MSPVSLKYGDGSGGRGENLPEFHSEREEWEQQKGKRPFTQGSKHTATIQHKYTHYRLTNTLGEEMANILGSSYFMISLLLPLRTFLAFYRMV